jgi:hypothetical protein
MQKKQSSGPRQNSAIENAALAKKQADKNWEKFASWINGKDVKGGPQIQAQAAKMRAARIRQELTNKPGGQTRRVSGAAARRIPGTK